MTSWSHDLGLLGLITLSVSCSTERSLHITALTSRKLLAVDSSAAETLDFRDVGVEEVGVLTFHRS